MGIISLKQRQAMETITGIPFTLESHDEGEIVQV
jgi:hypothetical protein